jgi:hypothetical protein
VVAKVNNVKTGRFGGLAVRMLVFKIVGAACLSFIRCFALSSNILVLSPSINGGNALFSASEIAGSCIASVECQDLMLLTRLCFVRTHF